VKCGKKLQSSRQPIGPSVDLPGPLNRFAHKGMSEDRWRSFKRMIEAWVYLGVLVGVAAVCSLYEIWWPLYPAVGLLTLLLVLRKI